MSDDGRLELDEDGRLLEDGRAVELVDLADPSAVEQIPVSRTQAWVDVSLAPWVHRHRRAVVAAVVTGTLVLGSVAWWQSRPAYVPPTVSVDLTPVALRGGGLPGAHITAGRLSVAYSARAATAGDSVEVLGLVGPGLEGSTVGGPVLGDGARSRLDLAATVDCSDAALTGAGPSSYGLQVRRTASDGDVLETQVPFSAASSDVGVAVLDHCIAQLAPSGLVALSARVQARPGDPTASLAIALRNDAPVALQVATQRRTDADVEVDLSPTVTVPAHGTAVLSSRVFLHDCSAPASLPTLGTLPDPVPGAAQSLPGIALQVGLGVETTLVSVPLPGGAVGEDLTSGVCSGRPTLSLRLESARGSRTTGGGWQVTGTYAVATSGMAVSVGREQFAGPAAGQGSVHVDAAPLVPGAPWRFSAAQLDGGAGRIPVVFTGGSCADLRGTSPPELEVTVSTPDGGRYPFAVPATASGDVRLSDAANAACGLRP